MNQEYTISHTFFGVECPTNFKVCRREPVGLMPLERQTKVCRDLMGTHYAGFRFDAGGGARLATMSESFKYKW